MDCDAAGDAADSFCVYLAKQYVATFGYRPGAIADAEPLADACDVMLTHREGPSLYIVCLIDRERTPGKIFPLSVGAVEAIGHTLLLRAGAQDRGAVGIQIMEVGPASADQQARLSAYRPAPGSRVGPSGWVVDTQAREVWTSGGDRSTVTVVHAWLTMAREPDALLRERRPFVRAPAADRRETVAIAKAPQPWLTYATIATLLAVFVAELHLETGLLNTSFELSPRVLAALGGVARTLVVDQGEWFRMFSAALLHGGVVHLAVNCVALFVGGRALENAVGAAWLGVTFTVSALGGALFSLLFNAPNIVSVGASGAITGVFMALFAAGFHHPKGPLRMAMHGPAVLVLLPLVLPLLPSVSRRSTPPVPPGRPPEPAPVIDFAAHVGGALAGILIGLLLLALWRRDAQRPRLRPLAAVLALAGLGGFVYPVLPITRSYPTYAYAGVLIPPAELPKTQSEANSRSAELIAKYPRDPRGHALRASALLQANDKAGMERELRAALAEEHLWQPLLTADFRLRVRTMLAMVLSTDRIDEAKAMAQPVCESTQDGEIRNMRELVERARLCAR